MENDLFQTSLYFFSALLQADAAILGFGTIFIIFKLQALDSLKQNIIQAYYTKGSGHISNVNSLLFSKKPEEIAKVISGAAEYDKRNYIHIVCIPKRAEQISNSIKLPIWIIGTHAVFCSILLSLSFKNIENVIFEQVLLLICLIWFAASVFLAGRLAIKILTKKEKYDLKELLVDVYKELYKDDVT